MIEVDDAFSLGEPYTSNRSVGAVPEIVPAVRAIDVNRRTCRNADVIMKPLSLLIFSESIRAAIIRREFLKATEHCCGGRTRTPVQQPSISTITVCLASTCTNSFALRWPHVAHRTG